MYRKIYTKIKDRFILLYMSQTESFSIRQLIELTGLTEFTIRGWENRYAAFSPVRGETGRRLYTKADVERALLLRELLKRGHKISKVAALSNRDLQKLFVQPEVEDVLKPEIQQSEDVAKALKLVALQKWTELEALIRGLSTKNVSDLVTNFFLPVMQSISTDVAKGLLSISQEHVVSSFLKEKIYGAIAELKAVGKGKSSKSRFVLATPEGDYHEIGLLLAHLLIRSYGYSCLYLGPHVPPRDLAETALRFGATHLLVVSTVSKRSGARQHLFNYVSDVQQKTNTDMQIWIAGHQVAIEAQDLKSMTHIKNFPALEEMLKKRGGRI